MSVIQADRVARTVLTTETYGGDRFVPLSGDLERLVAAGERLGGHLCLFVEELRALFYADEVVLADPVGYLGSSISSRSPAAKLVLLEVIGQDRPQQRIPGCPRWATHPLCTTHDCLHLDHHGRKTKCQCSGENDPS